MCSPRTHFEDLCPPQVLADNQDIGKYQRLLVEELRLEIDQTPSSVNRLLISNEHLHSRLGTLSGIEKMFEILAPYADTFTVIVFIRPQIECAVSLFNLALRRGATEFRLIPQFDGPRGFDRILGVAQSYFQYDELCSRYASIFGEAHVRPFIYETRAGADPLSILARETRLPVLPIIPFKNSSINVQAQYFQLRLNRAAKEAREGYGMDLLAFIDEFLTSNYRGRGLLPTRSDAAAFMDMFAAGNERVRAKYFPNAPSLFEQTWEQYPEGPDMLETDPDSEGIGLALIRAIWSQRVRTPKN
jgi:hypothetical protein